MHGPYTSSHLCHFVGWQTPDDNDVNWKSLVSILADQCVSHDPHDKGYGTTAYTVDMTKSLLDEKLIIPTVTCFADIPEASLKWHIAKYGRFGLSFDRKFLIRYGARPVMYVPTASDDWSSTYGKSLLRDVEAIYKGFKEHYVKQVPLTNKKGRTMGQKPETEEQVLNAVKSMLEKTFLAYVKPFDSDLPLEDRRSFYMEREWRKFGNLPFTFDDVVQVWVASGYADKLSTQFPALSKKVKELDFPPP